ncbi:fibronectin type III domain-containing protein [Rhodococcus sp. UNC363MFTsu5.1]|uniref:fibronectin type III domain-containing protein n=1 Tax=Rhodococcus sp. UNC363MFTsu5.1 TaxID=1449069 RepID=UPI000486F074|nr:fibronectin type III domain-containing protein [Rhodococcus sp. UNC363MFTsu5.1]
MTVPGGGYPEGTFDDDLSGLDGLNEAAWKNQKLGGIGSFDTAHENFKSEFISAQLFGGEVVRLDNRIDEIIIGSERALLYTYSEAAVWPKHPAAYKIVVDVLSGATGGTQPSGAPGAGGWSGGWERATFAGTDLEDLPPAISVTIGAGAGPGGTPGVSRFGTFVTAGAATNSNYGSGSRTFMMRGGNGGGEATNGADGSAGPFRPGASGGQRANGTGGHGHPGGHGFSISAGQIGTGSAGGGGGGGWGVFSAGASAGHGGWPSAPGGGRGMGTQGGGTSGNGAGGAVFVTAYLADTLGIPPSTPTGLAVSGVGKTTAHVSWNASIDDVAVKNYVMYLNGERYGVVTSTSWDFVGLAASTAYQVRVQAVDIGDNVSELSAPINFTTTA